MAAYHSFTTTRTTEPDRVALLTFLRGADASIGVQHEVGSNTYILKKDTAWTAGQVANAQQALDSAPEITPQRLAQNEIDQWPISTKALVLALLDQLNVLRANAGLAAITPAQVLSAVRAKAGTL